MNPITYFLAGLAVLGIHAVLAGIAVLIWIALGESDVNGDPERDAGIGFSQPHNPNQNQP